MGKKKSKGFKGCCYDPGRKCKELSPLLGFEMSSNNLDFSLKVSKVLNRIVCGSYDMQLVKHYCNSYRKLIQASKIRAICLI